MPTGIEYVDETWNPITGCTPISAGCANCWAKRNARRLAGRYGYDAENPFRITLHQDRMDAPSHWRKPRRVLVCSMGDLFHLHVTTDTIRKLFNTMVTYNGHTYLILTKRPQRMLDELAGWGEWDNPKLRRHIWLGISAEDQVTFDVRTAALLQIPAAVHFVSLEPLLGPIDITDCCPKNRERALKWVIAGGESGPVARPMDPLWLCGINTQCRLSRIPFFFKAWGHWHPAVWDNGEGDVCYPEQEYSGPETEIGGCRMIPTGYLKTEGFRTRLLQGNEYNELPTEANR